MVESDLNGAQHLNWSSIPVEHPAEGIERQMVVGQNLMICRFRFAPMLVTREHAHPHEQVGIVLEGKAVFYIGTEEKTLQPGDLYRIPGNTPHRVVAHDEPVRALDIFNPVREDYR